MTTNEEYMNLLNELIKEHPKAFSAIIKKSDVYHDLLDFIIKSTPKLNDEKYTLTTRAYWVVNGLTDFPKCANPLCNNTLEGKNVRNITDGYCRFCSKNCGSQSAESKEKRKATNLERYGSTNFLASDMGKEIKRQWAEEHGVENPFQLDWVNEKRKTTMMNKYGAEFTQQVPELIEKCHETCRKHYGVEHQWLSQEIKDKNKKTLIERYGTDNVFDLDFVREKQRISFRTDHYNDFLKSSKVIPLFSLQDYIDSKDYRHEVFKWKCVEKEGEEHIFESAVNANNFKRHGEYARCLICHPIEDRGYSDEEKDVYEFVKSISPYEVINHTEQNRTILDGKHEIDIIIPEIKLGIEFNGIFYHSSDNDNDERNKYRHIRKTDECTSKGWKLIQIFENEWIHHRDIVEYRLKALLGCSFPVISADDCSLEEIDAYEASEFHDSNSLGFFPPSPINISLKNNGKTVSVMSFRRNLAVGSYSIDSYSSLLNYNVKGGYARILEYFEKKYNPESLTIKIDRAWSNGKIFEKLGFTYKETTEPEYNYAKTWVIFPRQSFTMDRLPSLIDSFDPNKTEKENMLANGYRIIYDCGNLVFAKNYSNPS